MRLDAHINYTSVNCELIFGSDGGICIFLVIQVTWRHNILSLATAFEPLNSAMNPDGVKQKTDV